MILNISGNYFEIDLKYLKSGIKAKTRLLKQNELNNLIVTTELGNVEVYRRK